MDEQSIFLQALDKEQREERSAWLDEVCGRETPFRERIEALLDRHERANRFLERPALDSESASASVPGNDVAERREAGEASAFTSPEGVVMGSTNHSVLKSLGQTLDVVPRVVLRDTTRRGGDPIVRPASKEVPDRNADSRYQFLGEIAHGGMGAIIKGRDTDLGRDLAIKVLLESHKDKPEVIQRFVEEAQIGGQLQHPGIAPVYELGQFSDRRPFFSMKLVKGQTLSSLLAERDDSSEERAKFLGIFEQMCQTMAYAHSRGVIHRDLKPANIMVGAFGEVQVMDWGLAKVLAEGGVADEKKAHDTTQDKSIIQTLRSLGSDTPPGFGSDTQMGSVMGTPAYMAPEQALGEVDRLDERTDVFGLGAILCMILTGQPPYAGKDGTQVFRLAARGKLDHCFARLDACAADAELIDFAKRCLEVEQNDRPRNAGVLADRISRYLESVQTRLRETEMERAAQTARAEEERKRFRVTLALAASVLLLIGVAGGGWLWIGQQQAEQKRVATNKVTEALGEAKLHEGLAAAGELDDQLQELELAVRSAQRARNLAKEDVIDDSLRQVATQRLDGLTEREASVRAQAAQAAADRELQTELEQIRLSQADQGERLALTGATFFSVGAADKRYEEAFRKAGLDVLALEVSDAAAQISGRNEALRESIIAGLDNWVRAISDLTFTPEDQYHRYVQSSDYAAAAKLGRRLVEQDPANTELWLRLAPVLVLGGDEAAYREHCRRMAEQFAATDNEMTAERTLKACLLLPDAVDLAGLPQSPLASSLDAGNLPDWFLPWALFARALFAYRNSDYESALKYAQESEEHEIALAEIGHEFAKALNLAVRALAQHQLGNPDKSRSDLEESAAIVHGLLEKDYNPGNHHDLLATQILLREALLLLDGNVSPELLADIEPDSADVVASSANTRRERLLAVADKADPNPWRIKLRANLKSPDIAALKELAASEKTMEQSSELNAWLGAVLREAEELDASIIVLKEAQLDHPGDFWLNHELATSLLYSGKPAEAVEFARAALAVKPNSLGSLNTLAEALGEAGRSEDYYCIYRQFLPRIPLGIEDATAMWIFGHTPRRLNKLDKTIALSRGYTEAYPNDARGHLFLAVALGNVHEKLEDALLPLQRVIELKPNETAAYAYFTCYLGDKLTVQNKLDKAIEAYRIGTQFDPDNAFIWLRLAPVLVLAGDEEGYKEYCQDIVNKFAGTEVVNASIACKACLLMPDAIDLAELPQEIVARSLDDGTAPGWYHDGIAPVSYPPWGWNTRALLAYRSGDAEAAIQYVQKSEESIPDDFAKALNLTILALAHQNLGHIDNARKFAADAAKAIENLRQGPAAGNDTVVHHLLISQILLREAESNR